MAKKQILILKDVPRIDRYVYTVIRPDETQEHFTTRLAAYQFLRSLMPDKDLPQLTSYSQVSRDIAKRNHFTIATEGRRVYQIKRSEVRR